MGLLDWVGLTKEIPQTVDAISNLYTTDKARIIADTGLELAQQQRGLKQLDNNKLMLAANNFYQGGWQALVGWTAGFCVALYYIPQLIVANIEWAYIVLETHEFIAFPIDPTDILNLVYLLFGFGTYHLVKKKLIG